MNNISDVFLYGANPDVGKAFINELGNTFKPVTDTVDNFFTGNRDYNRQVDLQNRANAFTASESAKARVYNSREAQLQRDFEEHLSNTAYSRAFSDMRKNGINPYAMLGSASTPSGAVASSSGGRGASAYANRSGAGFDNFLGNLAITALNIAGRALTNGKVQAVQFFDRNGESNGGYYKYY